MLQESNGLFLRKMVVIMTVKQLTLKVKQVVPGASLIPVLLIFFVLCIYLSNYGSLSNDDPLLYSLFDQMLSLCPLARYI